MVALFFCSERLVWPFLVQPFFSHEFYVMVIFNFNQNFLEIKFLFRGKIFHVSFGAVSKKFLEKRFWKKKFVVQKLVAPRWKNFYHGN